MSQINSPFVSDHLSPEEIEEHLDSHATYLERLRLEAHLRYATGVTENDEQERLIAKQLSTFNEYRKERLKSLKEPIVEIQETPETVEEIKVPDPIEVPKPIKVQETQYSLRATLVSKPNRGRPPKAKK